MADPLTLLSIAGTCIYQYTTSEAGKAIVGGILGNRFDALFKDSITKIRGIASAGDLPQNADLLRAVLQAKLDATAYLGKEATRRLIALCRETGDRGEEGQAAQLERLLGRWIKEQRTLVKKGPDLPHNDPVYKEIELLLTGRENPREWRDTLVGTVKKSLVEELETGLCLDLPLLFKTLLFEGWEEDGLHLDWFDIMTLKFSELLKDPHKLRIRQAFENRLLSDISVGTQTINLRVEEVFSVVESNFAQLHAQMRKVWPLIEDWMARLGEDIKAIREDLGGLKHDVRELLEIYKTDTDRRQLLAAPEVRTIMEEIELLRTETLLAFNEKEEFLLELEKSPENKLAQKAYKAAFAEWTEKGKELQQKEETFSTLKQLIISQKQFFDQLDMDRASSRLKRAKALFGESDFSGVRSLLEESSREEERTDLKLRQENLTQALKNMADEDIVLADSILLQFDLPERFSLAKQYLLRSMDTFPYYYNQYRLGQLLIRLGRHEEAIAYLNKTLPDIDPDSQEFIEINADMGIVWYNLHEMAKAKTCFSTVRSKYATGDLKDGCFASYVRSVCALGSIARFFERDEEAKLFFLEAESMIRPVSNDKDLNAASIVYMSLASVAMNERDLSAARNWSQKNQALIASFPLSQSVMDIFDGRQYTLEGNILYQEKEWEKAEEWYEKALSTYRAIEVYNPERFDEEIGNAYHCLALCNVEQNKADRALHYYLIALDKMEKLTSRSPETFEVLLTSLLLDMSSLYEGSMDLEAAVVSKERAYELIQKRIEAKPDLGIKLFEVTKSLGSLKSRLNDHNSATHYLKKALSLASALTDSDEKYRKIRIGDALRALSNQYRLMYHFQEALEYGEKALAVVEELYREYGDKSLFELADTYKLTGNALAGLGDHEKAAEFLAKSRDIFYRLFEGDRNTHGESYAILLHDIGNHYYCRDAYDQAIPVYEEALELFKELSTIAIGSFEVFIANTYFSLGNSYTWMTPEAGKAEDYLKEALSRFRDLEAKNPDRFLWQNWCVLDALARLFDKRNDPEQSFMYFEQANDTLRRLTIVVPSMYERRYADNLYVLSCKLFDAKHWTRALPVILEAVTQNRLHPGKEPVKDLEAQIGLYEMLTDIYEKEMDNEKALEAWLERVSLNRRLLSLGQSDEKWPLVIALRKASWFCSRLKREQEALPYGLEAYRLIGELYASDPAKYRLSFAITARRVMSNYHGLKDFEKAIPYGLESFATYEQLSSIDPEKHNLEFMSAHLDLVELFYDAGDRDKAGVYLRLAQELIAIGTPKGYSFGNTLPLMEKWVTSLAPL